MKWFEKLIVEKAGAIMTRNKYREEAQQYSTKEKYALNSITAGSGYNTGGSISIGSTMKVNRDNDLESHADLHFRMYRAENGYAMEVRQYDKRTERQHTNLHLITDDQDLGQAISHIITLESLKVK